MVHNLAGRKKIYVSFSTNFFSRPPRVDTRQEEWLASYHIFPQTICASLGRHASSTKAACKGGVPRGHVHTDGLNEKPHLGAFHPLSRDKSCWGSMMQYNPVHLREAFERRKIAHMLHASLPAYPERPSLGGTYSTIFSEWEITLPEVEGKFPIKQKTLCSQPQAHVTLSKPRVSRMLLFLTLSTGHTVACNTSNDNNAVFPFQQGSLS